jgi:hypothetical protein
MILQVVGDDLLMSNAKRIDRAVTESACNTLLLKVTEHCFNFKRFSIFYNVNAKFYLLMEWILSCFLIKLRH